MPSTSKHLGVAQNCHYCHDRTQRTWGRMGRAKAKAFFKCRLGVLRNSFKSRHSFLHSVEPLDGSAHTRRLTLWSSHLQTTSHKLSFSPKESLPPGSSETWPTWSSLNHLRTGTGRCKSLMQKWVFNEDGQTTCECGDEQTMKHLLVCPILPQPCTHEDLEEFNPRARSCAQHWAGVV